MRRLLVGFITMLAVVLSGSGQNIHATPTMKARHGISALSGRVVETMNSGRYTYALIEKDGKKTWVAVPRMKIVVGQDISFKPGLEMTNFQSKTLKRTFDKIFFSEGPIERKISVNEMKSMGSKSNVIIPAEKISVKKASGPNAYTVAEIYRNKDRINNQKVAVRGKIVKVSPRIMNRNWIHLQDGTGDPKKGTHDIVVTSQDMPSVGDIVTATGTLSVDKDFGSGYTYEVLVENASITHSPRKNEE